MGRDRRALGGKSNHSPHLGFHGKGRVEILGDHDFRLTLHRVEAAGIIVLG